MFREYLRRDPVVRSEYAGLKDELATRHRDDREAYTEGKTAFVERAVALALGDAL